jgi:hypothetical protein
MGQSAILLYDAGVDLGVGHQTKKKRTKQTLQVCSYRTVRVTALPLIVTAE